jgi:hypothetical protein
MCLAFPAFGIILIYISIKEKGTDHLSEDAPKQFKRRKLTGILLGSSLLLVGCVVIWYAVKHFF